MNNTALIIVGAGRDEQYSNALFLSTQSTGEVPGINTTLQIQFACPNPNQMPSLDQISSAVYSNWFAPCPITPVDLTVIDITEW